MSELTGKGHTIEAVLQTTTSAELCAFRFFSWEDSVQGQTEEVVGEVSEDGIPGDQALESGPTSLLLKLFKV